MYRVQANFSGGNIPTVSTSFTDRDKAVKEYHAQKARKECSFCNLIKVDAELLMGDSAANTRDTFRFGL